MRGAHLQATPGEEGEANGRLSAEDWGGRTNVVMVVSAMRSRPRGTGWRQRQVSWSRLPTGRGGGHAAEGKGRQGKEWRKSRHHQTTGLEGR